MEGNQGKSQSTDETKFLKELHPTEIPCLMAITGALGKAQDAVKEGLLKNQSLEEIERQIDRVIEILMIQQAMFPGANDYGFLSIAALTETLVSKFDCTSIITFLNLAIKTMEQATILQDLYEGSSERLPQLLCLMGVTYATRYGQLHDDSDLTKALECQGRVISLWPDVDELDDLPSEIGQIGVAYLQRHQDQGRQSDVDFSIHLLSNSLNMLPEGHEKIPSLLNYLGCAHKARFDDCGFASDIDKAVQCHLKALEVTPEGHKDLPSYINNLGNAYRIRFKKLGCREDLERSIECGHEVLAIAPEDDRHRSYWMNNLGNSYILRFKRYNQMDNLDKAIAYHETAVKSASQGDPNLPVLYNSLGVSRKQRFNRLSDPGDLDKAIEHQTQGLLLTNDGHPLLPDWSMNLGASLIMRFKRVGQATDADMAIKYLSQAVSLTPEFNPELPNRLNSLAVGYLALSKHQHAKFGVSSAQKAFECYQKSAQCPVGDSMVRFRSSLNWARAADEFGMGENERLQGYKTAFSLVPQLVSLGATVAQRYLDVEEIGRAPMEAAAAAIDAQEYEMALEWLELGRSVVWGQVLQLQQPLDSLSATHPELADELRRVAQSLNKSSIDPQNGSVDAVEPSNTHSNEMAAQMYRRLAEQYDRLVHEIRQLPGFEGFLMSKRISSLICACRDGPVVFVNIHSSRCDALALIPGTADVVLVPLPTFSYFQSKKSHADLSAAIGSLGARNRGFRRPFSDDLPSQDTFELVLAELWIHVAKPVLSALGCLQPIKGSNLPHVTWCTTGAMSFLPLHAAGLYGCRQEKVSDYVISSYAPSISALLYQRPTPKTRPRVLLIGQGATPGQSPLPGAKKELDALSSLIPDYSILDDRKATTTNVLKAMESNEWVHLACHAHQCVSDPLQSGFFLHDGTLNLAMIIGRHFGNKGLAFLSACQTASGDEVIPDESVHLASGLLAAGYPSVIATMWSVHDQDAPMVAASVYRTLLKDWNMDHRKSAHALHRAVIELRANIGEKEFSRWVPYVHFGA